MRYFVYLFGTILATFGLILLAIYISLFFFSPVVENVFAINVNISYALLVISVSFATTGIFLGFYAISQNTWEYANIWLIVSLVLSIISFLFQLYKLASMGPTWIGLEFFGSEGNRIEAMYIDMLLFLTNLIVLITTSTLTYLSVRGGE
ncbi:hypothetical protein SU69_09360 [Thermosipho melanesiensis]|uniref:Uncharacterized protein n=2 Tax=Thermosipho melanesiensis TaxID=46541 RepID=A6LP37_THEM4|nr:hypothetical protein [Thermosipho melanesiensis]ABR31688.1 hypothetical protein Tmel_1853 [Thermosipho melanesiensis BI429]APT74711.1 hypothetical protein BW47_09740 [Thermosipho melanesiensis]OOC35212.1 hypothetical protein SU69_09360 [Thermosipho melanesiensis]OOC35422.1 hypothetical protein SU70_09370 [Thermosipho melanesiensis]OOC36673.1 hypothetical protein SU68_09430 [Thermosipho melanesiensis]